jgi:hypothetical protein
MKYMGLIDFDEVVMITKIDGTITEAESLERLLILSSKQKALDELGFENIYSIFLYGKQEKYYRLIYRFLDDDETWQRERNHRYSEQIRIYFHPEYIKEKLIKNGIDSKKLLNDLVIQTRRKSYQREIQKQEQKIESYYMEFLENCNDDERFLFGGQEGEERIRLARMEAETHGEKIFILPQNYSIQCEILIDELLTVEGGE